MNGIAIGSTYRFFEHAGWLLFINAVLLKSCQRSEAEATESCQREAALEITNRDIEQRVKRRTQELEHARRDLAQEFAQHKATQNERELLYDELVKASRKAGMAEVATGVLHNVGNVLNSVNVSANLLVNQFRSSRIVSLRKAAQVISEKEDELGDFLMNDERGQNFPQLLDRLAENLTQEHGLQLEELHSLIAHIEHIKEIVAMQQTFARAGGTTEPLSVSELFDDAIKINDVSLIRHSVDVERHFDDVPFIKTDRHRVLQILVKLIGNAKQSLTTSRREDKIMTLAIREDVENVRIQVRDNGGGITKENLALIFTHGFTTKHDGHGFGLHTSALMAQELGGSLSVKSDGLGHGAVFTLTIPAKIEELCKV